MRSRCLPPAGGVRLTVHGLPLALIGTGLHGVIALPSRVLLPRLVSGALRGAVPLALGQANRTVATSAVRDRTGAATAIVLCGRPRRIARTRWVLALRMGCGRGIWGARRRAATVRRAGRGLQGRTGSRDRWGPGPFRRSAFPAGRGPALRCFAESISKSQGYSQHVMGVADSGRGKSSRSHRRTSAVDEDQRGRHEDGEEQGGAYLGRSVGSHGPPLDAGAAAIERFGTNRTKGKWLLSQGHSA